MREIAAAIIDDTVLTIRQTDEGLFTYKAEYPGGGPATSAHADVRHAFYAMGREAHVLLHAEKMKGERV